MPFVPTIIAHAAFGWSLARLATPHAAPKLARRAADAAFLLAMLPDADVVGFRFGIQYGDLLGHRGISHSVAFAAVVAGLTAAGLVARAQDRRGAGAVALALFLAAVSHPLLDMLTDGGLGVALWAPLSPERLFFPVTPIPVSPIGVGPGLTRVLLFEAMVFGPFALIAWLASRKMAQWLRPKS